VSVSYFLFQGLIKVGFSAVKVFVKKYYPQAWRFFAKHEVPDLYSTSKNRKYLCPQEKKMRVFNAHGRYVIRIEELWKN
jgi:hypothetical protein